ncbi:MAG: hypothetical protein NC123_13060 [Butyrivibrio sp.]|nr:hypothetical protein [Acetatifactor muris]MCM1558087.1 hypothetical protein [Butyrivibrio sp.]MCM1560450.1 hypothetical protein [Butyrivibrio sp.]
MVKKEKSLKISSCLLLLFFALMLAGTFFHQAIDDALFRVKVETVLPESYLQKEQETVTLNGTEVEAWKYNSFWRLPPGAVSDGFCFVLEEVNTEYGRYYTVRKRSVEVAAEETDGSVLISAGLSGKEQVVTASDGELEDGMRVAFSD